MGRRRAWRRNLPGLRLKGRVSNIRHLEKRQTWKVSSQIREDLRGQFSPQVPAEQGMDGRQRGGQHPASWEGRAPASPQPVLASGGPRARSGAGTGRVSTSRSVGSSSPVTVATLTAPCPRASGESAGGSPAAHDSDGPQVWCPQDWVTRTLGVPSRAGAQSNNSSSSCPAGTSGQARCPGTAQNQPPRPAPGPRRGAAAQSWFIIGQFRGRG